MRLIHEATLHNWDGTIDVHIFIVNHSVKKKYVYTIKNAWAVSRFLIFYHKGIQFHGKALTYLNKFKIKPETTT